MKRSGGTSAPSPTKGSVSVQDSVQPCTILSGESNNNSGPDPRPTIVPSSKPSSTPRKPPWTSPWYADRLCDQPAHRAIALLRVLTHPQRQQEATEDVLQELNRLSSEAAAEAIQELHGPKRFIRGPGSSLTIHTQLTTLDDQRQFPLRALVDSRCTGSSIDSGFVQAKGLNIHPLP